MNDLGITIGQVGKQTGVSTQAIRYYEREGLVPKPLRTHTGYRMYGPEVLGRLNFIRTARTLGLSLDEIKEIFRMSRAGRAPCCRVRELLADKLDGLNRRIAELSRFRKELRGFLRKLSGVPDQADTSQHICALIEMAPSLLSLPMPSNERSGLGRSRRESRVIHKTRPKQTRNARGESP